MSLHPRNILFRHLDGIAIIPTLLALEEKNIISYLKDFKSEYSLLEIKDKFKCNGAYLNIALRLFASQGWIKRTINNSNILFKSTNSGLLTFNQIEYLKKYKLLLKYYVNLKKYLLSRHANSFDEIFNLAVTEFIRHPLKESIAGSNEFQNFKHCEGFILGPIFACLGMNNLIEIINNKIVLDNINASNKNIIFTLFKEIDLIDSNNGITDLGHFFFKRLSAYGVTVSYLPTFNKIPQLLFGDSTVLWIPKSDGSESHVDRKMNVWGSGGAHKTYFKKIDKIIIDIFNQPLDQQPLGIADMGCGDGTFLEHMYEIIENQTLRGSHLSSQPLLIIGADLNRAAIEVTKSRLRRLNTDCFIIESDISSPDKFAKILKSDFNVELKDMLNVRSFLDHNRIYSPPKEKRPISTKIESSGSFAHRGKLIPNNQLKQNLIEHFNQWKPYAKNHGLLILELHTIHPEIASSDIGNNVATAYDATHGYSDQYIIEHDNFIECANLAGLHELKENQFTFPNSKMTTISINLFKS